MAPPGGTADDIPGWKNAVAGGFSGMAYWTAFYPADTVKSQQQTNPKLNGQNFATTLQHIYRTEGFRALYKVGGSINARRPWRPGGGGVIFPGSPITPPRAPPFSSRFRPRAGESP
jgi:hypothetical protein